MKSITKSRHGVENQNAESPMEYSSPVLVKFNLTKLLRRATDHQIEFPIWSQMVWKFSIRNCVLKPWHL